jgi:hypothetical protein
MPLPRVGRACRGLLVGRGLWPRSPPVRDSFSEASVHASQPLGPTFRFRRRGDFAILQTASVRHSPSRGGKLRGSGALAASFGANDIAFGTDPDRQRPPYRDVRFHPGAT